MELEGVVHNVGAVETKGADFNVAEIILDRKSSFEGREFPNFTKITLQGKKTELISQRDLMPGDYVRVTGDIKGRFFQHDGKEKHAQDFVVWDIEVKTKAQPQNPPQNAATSNYM